MKKINQVILDKKSNVCYLGDIIEKDQTIKFIAKRVSLLFKSDEAFEYTDEALEILGLKNEDSFPNFGSIDEVLNSIADNNKISCYLTDNAQKILDSLNKDDD